MHAFGFAEYVAFTIYDKTKTKEERKSREEAKI